MTAIVIEERLKVNTPNIMSRTGFADAGNSVLRDPRLPIFHWSKEVPTSRPSQRLRRAQILATVRELLAQHGLEGVTMRGIAEGSGLAVQTIYNLAGPRDQVIVEAISEYSRQVGLIALPDPEDPNAVIEIIDRWVEAVESAPEFCRQTCLIFFTPSRSIFYHFRDLQLKAMRTLLARQQKCGVLRPDANIRDLAEQLIHHASALCVEWSDRPFPLDRLHQRLCSGFTGLLSGSTEPGAIRLWRSAG